MHLSGELSGTLESAQLAAPRSPVPVTVVDSRQVGMGTGFAVLAAADALDDGADAAAAAQAARRRAAGTTSLFYVDTLEYLRRGGRIGAVGALVGSALAVKPLLTLQDGRVVPLERVRTANKALSRLEELAVQAAGSAPRRRRRVPPGQSRTGRGAGARGRRPPRRLPRGPPGRRGGDRCRARRPCRPGHGGRGRVPARVSRSASTGRSSTRLSTGSRSGPSGRRARFLASEHVPAVAGGSGGSGAATPRAAAPRARAVRSSAPRRRSCRVVR